MGGNRNHSQFIKVRIVWTTNFLAELYLNVIRKVERSPISMGQMTRCPFKQKRSARLKCGQGSLNTVAVHGGLFLHPQWQTDIWLPSFNFCWWTSRNQKHGLALMWSRRNNLRLLKGCFGQPCQCCHKK